MFEQAMRKAAMAERIRARSARVRKCAFRAGDFVEVHSRQGLPRPAQRVIYVVAQVHPSGLVTLEGQRRTAYRPCRFKFIKRAAELAVKQAELDFDEPSDQPRARRREARALSRAETWNAQHPPHRDTLGPLTP